MVQTLHFLLDRDDISPAGEEQLEGVQLDFQRH
jgi:hypothetical protein